MFEFSSVCYKCKFIVYDSFCDGYCSNKKRKTETQENTLVITDNGCKITNCKYFKEGSNN